MVELQTVKLGFELPDLPAVGIHLLLGALPVFVDLLYDDFGVTISQQTLDAECNGDPETVNESFVLSSVVGSLEKLLKDIFELFIFRGDEEDSSTSSITVEGAVEVHDLVLGSGVGWRVLDLGPFSDEVGQRVRFYHGSWHKLNRNGTEFY